MAPAAQRAPAPPALAIALGAAAAALWRMPSTASGDAQGPAVDALADPALAADNECQGAPPPRVPAMAGPGRGGDGEGPAAPRALADCALSALQVRGHRAGPSRASAGTAEAAVAPAWQGSCREYGCAAGYVAGQACQCNAVCLAFGNCCPDFWMRCFSMPQRGNCKEYGCVGYNPSQSCQCNVNCRAHGNCCPDYSSRCTPLHHRFAPVTTHPGTVGRRLHGHPIPGKHYPERDGFTLVLVEEFDQPLDLDRDPIWTWSDGGLPGQGQVRFLKDAISFKQGRMRISVDRYRGQPVQSCSMAEKGHIGHMPLASGELRTRYNLFRYGYYEVSMRAPEVQLGNPYIEGNFISSFFVFRDSKFDHWREIDVEILANAPGYLQTNILYANHVGSWRKDIEFAKPYYTQTLNLRRGFHTVGFEWLPHRIRWYIDGNLIREHRGEKLPIPELSAKIMMNLWVFENRPLMFGGNRVQNNWYPMHSEYDWFRFYKWDGDTQYPCPSMDGSCLSVKDKQLSSNNPCDGIRQVGTVNGVAPCKAKC